MNKYLYVKNAVIIMLLILGAAQGAWGQDAPRAGGAAPRAGGAAPRAGGAAPRAGGAAPRAGGAAPRADGAARLRVENIEYHITGRTQEFALAAYAGVLAGTEFADTAALEKYIHEKTQTLLNNRVFSDARIEYTLAEETEGIIPVHLDIFTVDTFNFIILPYPKYDSNTGFLFRLRIFDNNTLGTMSLLKGDIGYTYTRDSPVDEYRHSMLLALDTNLPFIALGHTWNALIYSKTLWSPGYERPITSDNVLGLSINIPVKSAVFTAGFNEGISLIAKNETLDVDWIDTIFVPDTVLRAEDYLTSKTGALLDGWYLSSEPYISWNVPFGIKPFGAAELVYDVNVSGKMKYIPGGAISKANEGMEIKLNQRVGFNGINWLSNFRNGNLAYIQNDNTFNVMHKNLSTAVSAVYVHHIKIAEFFGISGRFRYKQWFRTDESYVYQSQAEAGSVLRGVRDKSILANLAFSLNLDFPFRLFMFMPSEWFNSRRLRYFNFELHLAPVIDIALIDGTQFDERYIPIKDISFHFNNIFAAAGMELLFFPLSWRSFYIRFSCGIDIIAAASQGGIGPNYEIFFGIGHGY
ncbi:MAG: hypothetical protein LBD20_00280 [Spirochaetaceae bacterium]|jgi:hypothetical protein|nr:hypothetical protein [Spirochaetaceae bacterium]